MNDQSSATAGQLTSSTRQMPNSPFAAASCLGGSDEILSANARLPENTRQSADLKLTMEWHNASTPVGVTKHHMAPALADLMKPQLAERPYRVSS